MRDRTYLRNALKRMIHDKAPHIMHLTDIDGALYRKSSRTLRICEMKYRQETLTDSQRDVLPVVSECVRLGVENKIIAPGSGVYVLRWDEKDPTVSVRTIGNTETKESVIEIPLDEFLARWACCL